MGGSKLFFDFSENLGSNTENPTKGYQRAKIPEDVFKQCNHSKLLKHFYFVEEEENENKKIFQEGLQELYKLIQRDDKIDDIHKDLIGGDFIGGLCFSISEGYQTVLVKVLSRLFYQPTLVEDYLGHFLWEGCKSKVVEAEGITYPLNTCEEFCTFIFKFYRIRD